MFFPPSLWLRSPIMWQLAWILLYNMLFAHLFFVVAPFELSYFGSIFYLKNDKIHYQSTMPSLEGVKSFSKDRNENLGLFNRSKLAHKASWAWLDLNGLELEFGSNNEAKPKLSHRFISIDWLINQIQHSLCLLDFDFDFDWTEAWVLTQVMRIEAWASSR